MNVGDSKVLLRASRPNEAEVHVHAYPHGHEPVLVRLRPGDKLTFTYTVGINYDLEPSQ